MREMIIDPGRPTLDSRTGAASPVAPSATAHSVGVE